MFSTDLSHSTIRAIIFAAGSDGDIHPHLGLAAELARRGHHVIFLTSFDYVDLACSCGFEVVSIMDVSDKAAFEAAQDLSPVRQIRSRCDFFSRKVSAICELVASRLDERSVLVAPPFAWPIAKLLHICHRVPYVSTVLSPASLCSRRDPPAFKSGAWFSRLPSSMRRLLFGGMEYLLVDPAFQWLVKDLLRTMHVPAPHRVISKWSHSPQKVLAMFPEWFCPRPADWPAHLVFAGFPLFHPRAAAAELPAGLRRFLESGPPPVVFTAGTETRTARDFFAIALRTAQTLGRRAVFLSRLGDQLPSLPDSIHYERYVSLELLLPRTAGIVHHGGIGTAARAMQAGIPQLILPARLDQFDNARHIEKLGCGLAGNNLLDHAAVEQKLRWMLDSSQMAERCRSLRDRLIAGSLACRRAADIIEQLSDSMPGSPRPVVPQGLDSEQPNSPAYIMRVSPRGTALKPRLDRSRARSLVCMGGRKASCAGIASSLRNPRPAGRTRAADRDPAAGDIRFG
jgi:rhamnosyltransferase subunit B